MANLTLEDLMAKITLGHLSYSRRGKKIIQDISFTLEKGERLALLGPNGAGKTTLFCLLAEVIRPDGGTVYFDNHQTFAPIKNEVGAVWDKLTLFPFLKVKEVIRFVSAMYGLRFYFVFFSGRPAGLGHEKPLEECSRYEFCFFHPSFSKRYLLSDDRSKPCLGARGKLAVDGSGTGPCLGERAGYISGHALDWGTGSRVRRSVENEKSAARIGGSKLINPNNV